MIYFELRVSVFIIMIYILFFVYIVDIIEVGLVLYIFKNIDFFCGAIEFISFFEFMLNKFKKI